MAADPKTASLYSRMQSYGTLIEAPRDVPDARFALPATVHWMRALAIATVDQKLNFAAGTARGQLGPLPNPVDEATASGCKSLPAWTPLPEPGEKDLMARIQHIITLHNDEWTVVVDGKHSAPYATQKENKIGITVNTSTSIRAKPKRWL